MLYRILRDPDIPVEILIILLKHNILQETITPITILYHIPPLIIISKVFSANDKTMEQSAPKYNIYKC